MTSLKVVIVALSIFITHEVYRCLLVFQQVEVGVVHLLRQVVEVGLVVVEGHTYRPYLVVVVGPHTIGCDSDPRKTAILPSQGVYDPEV